MVNRKWPAAERWARIGERDPSWMVHVPKAGLCLSAFVIIRKGDSFLLGRPHASKAWPERGGYPMGPASVLEKEGSWLLPATHLMMDESPDHAAKRVANEWAGVGGTPRFMMVQSHTRPRAKSRSGKRLNHWDICFVYNLQTQSNPKPLPWWSETRFFQPDQVARKKLGRGHKDVLKAAKLL
jgi:ADP-ribose pyrophosphatase YjhB (NUDIX family)